MISSRRIEGLRAWTVVFGVVLIGLWLVGLNSANSVGWMTWLDGAAGVLAFVLSSSIGLTASRQVNFGGPVAFAVGLFAMWIIGLASGAPSWQNWWNFALGCCFAILAGMSSGRVEAVHPGEIPTSLEEERERLRRRAS